MPEKVIQEIILAYQSSKHEAFLLEAQDDLSRISWCTEVLRKPVVPGQQVDLKGSEEEHVFNYLNASALIHWKYECKCGKQYYTVNCLEVNVGTQLVDFHRTDDPSCGPFHHKKCEKCRQHFEFKEVLVPEPTWLLRVVFHKLKGTGAHPEALPPFLSFDKHVFKLGYISYHHKNKGQLLHQTSCHLIQDQWFHYDGAGFGGELRKVPNTLLPTRYTPIQAVYYKIMDSTIPEVEKLNNN
jgi:hypothetical protein